MELDRYIISIDATTCLCTIGEVEFTSKGMKAKNKCIFPMERSIIHFGIKALGKKAKIVLKDNNVIESVIPYDKNSYRSYTTTIGFSGFILSKLDVIQNKIEFSLENKKEFYVLAFAPPSIQQLALPLLGQKVNFELSTKERRLIDVNKKVVSVSSYQDWGINSMISESI